MTDEEKVKEYATEIAKCKECRNHNFCHKIENEYLPKCEKWEWLFIGIKDGLAEGRKEKCLEQNKDGTIRPCEVMKENEELKAEIENLKKTYRKQRNRRIDELQKENEQLKQQVKEYLEMPCTSCCITESLESDLTDLNYQFVNLEAKTKVIEKENEILKNIISTVLDKEDICYICQMKGQVLPECMRIENSECLKNMISLWSK